MSNVMAFVVSKEDVLLVLQHFSVKEVNRGGMPHSELAKETHADLTEPELARIAHAALAEDIDLGNRSCAAHVELAVILQERGIFQRFPL